MEGKIKKLILDTGAFVSRMPVWDYGEEFYTVQDVIKEIKDRQTRNYINTLFQVQFREPSSSSLKFIVEFTKKSGDYGGLSLTDIKLLALTYEFESELKGGTSHLRTEPIIRRTEQLASKKCPESNIPEKLEGFYVSSNNKEAKNEHEANIEEVISNSPTSGLDFDHIELCSHHLSIIDFYFKHHSYVQGHTISEYDVFLFNQLNEKFPLLYEFSRIVRLHKKGNNFNVLIRHYRLLEQSFTTINQQKSSTIQQESNNSNAVLLPTSGTGSSSFSTLHRFLEEYSYQSHLVRWIWHILSYDQDRLDVLDSSVSHLNISDVLRDMCSINEKENEWKYQVEYDDCIDTLSDDDSENECIRDEEIFSELTANDYNEEGDASETDEDYSSYGSDDDDDEGWITPSNIKGLRNPKIDTETVDVACVTVDYAMQNTLKHIGLSVIGINGRIINEVRTFILRCHACFRTTDKMDMIFCPNCGHKTLKKVSVTLNPDGTQKIWISTRKPINIKGTKFSLPKPKGGKHGRNPILVSDQREAQQRASRLAKMKNNPLNADYDSRAGGVPFTTRDVYSRSAQLGIKAGKKGHSGTFYWERRNPNEPIKKATSKRKRNR